MEKLKWKNTSCKIHDSPKLQAVALNPVPIVLEISELK